MSHEFAMKSTDTPKTPCVNLQIPNQKNTFENTKSPNSTLVLSDIKNLIKDYKKNK